MLAQVQVTVGDFAAAETNYRSALRLVPDSQVALLGLGVLLNQTRRPAEAESLLRAAAGNTAQTAVLAGKDCATISACRWICRARRKRRFEAWQRAIALDPTNAEAHRELNALLYRMGRAQEFLDVL